MTGELPDPPVFSFSLLEMSPGEFIRCSMVVRIKSKFFVAGIVIRGGMVIGAAPIVKFMEGWTALKACNYAKLRGWSWMKVDTTDATD